MNDPPRCRGQLVASDGRCAQTPTVCMHVNTIYMYKEIIHTYRFGQLNVHDLFGSIMRQVQL